MNAGPVRNWRPFQFDELEAFSRRQVDAWNAMLRLFGGAAGWHKWISEGLAEFLESPAGLQIELQQQHTAEPDTPGATFTFDAQELTLGRDDRCDVKLTPRSVAKHHARIFVRSGVCYLEDLGSSIGTFLNRTRLAANTPAQLGTGDQFSIFPYTFTVDITERWVRNARVEVQPGSLVPTYWHTFQKAAVRDRVLLVVELHPIGRAMAVEAGRAFLERLAGHVLAPLGVQVVERLGLTEADSGLFELLAAAVLERINRDIEVPVQAALARFDGPPPFADRDAGLSLSLGVRVADLGGTLRLFVPDETVNALGRAASPRGLTDAPASWSFPLSRGYVTLTQAEVAAIEPSDVVLITRELALLFPGTAERGWRLFQKRSNVPRAVVDNYFERDSLSDSENEANIHSGVQPDFTSLPIRMHAIVGEKEMTLAEANLLVAGSIVELDRIKTDPVRIALNGKIAGEGELVEIEGRLGVRILAWRGR